MAKKKTKTDPQASAVPQPEKPAARASQGKKAAPKGKRGQAPDASTVPTATATSPEANGTTTAAPRRRAGRGQAKPQKFNKTPPSLWYGNCSR